MGGEALDARDSATHEPIKLEIRQIRVGEAQGAGADPGADRGADPKSWVSGVRDEATTGQYQEAVAGPGIRLGVQGLGSTGEAGGWVKNEGGDGVNLRAKGHRLVSGRTGQRVQG